jgi:hypothetical protein
LSTHPFFLSSKWIVVGRYRPQELPIPSLRYVAWHWVDRLVHTWEIWVRQIAISISRALPCCVIVGSLPSRSDSAGFVQ